MMIERCDTVSGKYTVHHLWCMSVVGGQVLKSNVADTKNMWHVLASRTNYDSSDICIQNRPRTHCTRLDCTVNRTATQIASEQFAGFCDGIDLGMLCHVMAT